MYRRNPALVERGERTDGGHGDSSVAPSGSGGQAEELAVEGLDQTVGDQPVQRPVALQRVAEHAVWGGVDEALPGHRAVGVPQGGEQQAADLAVGAVVGLPAARGPVVPAEPRGATGTGRRRGRRAQRGALAVQTRAPSSIEATAQRGARVGVGQQGLGERGLGGRERPAAGTRRPLDERGRGPGGRWCRARRAGAPNANDATAAAV